MEKGLIHLYCGEGKGKTTASLGLILRASGAGYKVVMMQCFKGTESSELKSLEMIPGIKIIHACLPEKFTWELEDYQKENLASMHVKMFERAVDLLEDDEKTLFVMDEMIGATTYGYMDKNMVLTFLREKPDNVEVVMTGRNPLPEFVEIADYVSDVNKVKHPYDRGIIARKGIEY